MAMTKDQIKASYPLPVYNFRVEINGEAIGFTEVSGLNIAYDTITHIEHGQNLPVSPEDLEHLGVRPALEVQGGSEAAPAAPFGRRPPMPNL